MPIGPALNGMGKKSVGSCAAGSTRSELRVTGNGTGIIDRKSLGVSSAQRADINHARGFAPEKRAAFRIVELWARETDYLVEAVNAIRAAEGLPVQSSQIDDRSVGEKGRMPDGEISARRGNRRVAHH